MNQDTAPTDSDGDQHTRGPVPSDRLVRGMVILVIVGGLVALIAIGARVYILSEHSREQDQTIGQLAGGLNEANDRLKEAGEQPVPVPEEVEGVGSGEPETQDAETQNPEVQESETQDPELQDPENQQPERDDPDPNDPDPNDPEIQDPENQDPEGQDNETDDPDPDDPEKQDPENQDPEEDDPDPNSLLNFTVRDECQPTPGEYVVDAGISVEQTPERITYVLTCTTAALPQAVLNLF